MDEATCRVCGKPTEGRLYCKPEPGKARSKCAKRWENYRHKHGEAPPLGHWLGSAAPDAPFDCAQCGARCVPGENVAAHASKFCSLACKSRWHKHDPDGCEYRPRAKWPKCPVAAAPRPRRFIFGACPRDGCGVLVMRVDRPHAKGYCSRKCMQIALRPMARRRYRARYGSDEYRRRARRFGVKYQPVDKRIIFKRDGYVCGVCGITTDPEADRNAPNYPSLDHIWPMSRGGYHEPSNLWCVCRQCNAEKSDQLDMDLMREAWVRVECRTRGLDEEKYVEGRA